MQQRYLSFVKGSGPQSTCGLREERYPGYPCVFVLLKMLKRLSTARYD